MNGTFNEKNCLINLKDEELVTKFISGEKETFKILYERYKEMIFNLSYRILYIHQLNTEEKRKNAEDATQDIFLKAWKGLDKFKEKSSFKTWLYRIAINHLLNERKRIRKEIKKREDMKEEIPSSTYDPDKISKKKEIEECAKKAVSALEETHLLVFTLRHYEGLEYEKIAEILRIPVGTVKSRFARAFEKMKDELKKCGCI